MKKSAFLIIALLICALPVIAQQKVYTDQDYRSVSRIKNLPAPTSNNEPLTKGSSSIVNADINNTAAIALSKLQTISTNRLLGRTTAGSGAIEEITPGNGLNLSSGTLALAEQILASANAADTKTGQISAYSTVTGRPVFYGLLTVASANGAMIDRDVADNGALILQFDNYASAGGSFIGSGYVLRAARGTRSSPADVASGDRMGFNVFGGYAGGGFRLPASAVEDWDTNQETIRLERERQRAIWRERKAQQERDLATWQQLPRDEQRRTEQPVLTEPEPPAYQKKPRPAWITDRINAKKEKDKK